MEVTEAGVLCAGKRWSWHDLWNAHSDEGWLSATLFLEGPNGFRLDGFPKRKARSLLALGDIARRVHDAHARIDKCLNSAGFVADNDRRLVVGQIVGDICPPGWDSSRHHLRTVPALQRQYLDVKRFLDESRAVIDSRNARFIESELRGWSQWFAKVEKTPLTDEQAHAVVVMEDRNLLVAAAGSGKTSTIVAKAAYVLAKGYCQPNELLILTFNRRIREELSGRLRDRLSAASLPTEVAVETFNAFGFRQVRRLYKGSRLAPWADSQAKELALLTSLVSGLAKRDPRFAYDLAEFSAVWFESDEKEESEITLVAGASSLEEAVRRLSARAASKGAVPTYTTLNGETVRSLQELRICNWLALMGIKYEYERPFDKALLPPGWVSGYRPDFYYPEIDCWHEHFGINKLGKAPPWMSRRGNERQRTYEDEVVQKREVLSDSGVDWFETKSADFDDSTWGKILQRELSARGLSLSFIGWERFEREVKDIQHVIKDVVRLIGSCLHHAKSNRLSPSEITVIETEVHSPRTRAFLKAFVPIFQAYEAGLRERGDFDFEDMVTLSAEAFREGRLHHPFRLILVDEFQDVSNSRAELLSAMLSQSPDVRLFGVGDDWQSIYRFAGADITAMTKFEDRFGYTATNQLTRTFRSNQFISDAAAKFVTRNPAQLKKPVRALSPGDPSSIEVVFHAGDHESFLEHELVALAQQQRSNAKRISVLLLGRYNFLEPNQLAFWQTTFQQSLDLSFLTIHRAKGLEADIVFLLGASNRSGRDFPSTIQDDPVLSCFMPAADQMVWAEERRLFYVALTRSRSKTYILSPEGEASPFVVELLSIQPVSQSLHSGKRKLPISDARPFLRLNQCPQCERGSIITRTSRFGRFEFCTLKCGYKRNLA